MKKINKKQFAREIRDFASKINDEENMRKKRMIVAIGLIVAISFILGASIMKIGNIIQEKNFFEQAICIKGKIIEPIFEERYNNIISPEIYKKLKNDIQPKLCSLCSKPINVNENRGIGFRGNGILVHKDCEEKESQLNG
jgi:hypothetical protein